MSGVGVVELEGLALQPGIGRLIPALGACLARAGRPLEGAVLAGLFGHAFESSYALGGAELWAHGELEWTHFGQGVARLGVRRQVTDRIGRPLEGPELGDAEWRAGLEEAFRHVEASLRRGVPALCWSPMSVAQRDAGVGAFNWGLLLGIDPFAREYLVLHEAGRFRAPAFELGRCDPRNWLHVVCFLGPEEGFDEEAARASAWSDAGLLLSGERASAIQPAAADRLRHGVAALEAFADDVAGGLDGSWRASYWASAREAAAAFATWAARPALAERFTAQAEALRRAGQDAGAAREAARLQAEVLARLRD